jgi:hypothetical protein
VVLQSPHISKYACITLNYRAKGAVDFQKKNKTAPAIKAAAASLPLNFGIRAGRVSSSEKRSHLIATLSQLNQIGRRLKGPIAERKRDFCLNFCRAPGCCQNVFAAERGKTKTEMVQEFRMPETVAATVETQIRRL